MRVLITGNMGYVGSVFVPYLKNISNSDVAEFHADLARSFVDSIVDLNLLSLFSNYSFFTFS
jgi:UDP-glucose 4-epimerase